MRHPLCSVIWLCGDSGVYLLCARHQLLLRPPLVSCLTGCFKTPAAKVWRPAHGRLCPGCHVLLDSLSMLRAACSAPSGVHYVGRTPCGWRHPPSTFNWSRAAWSGSRPGPKHPRPGMYWGALLLGLTGSSSACWGLSFWSVLSQILRQSRRVDPDRVLDFLPALFAGSASAPTLLCPMHRPEAIPWIRSLLQEHWSSVSTLPMPAAYALVGVHSAKARQLNLSESLRRIQGHHKPVGSESSVHLYGRDDIGPMLLLQQDIRKHIHSGFRPLQPVARGYSDPVPDFRVDFSAAVIGSLSPSGPASHVSSESEAPGWAVVTTHPRRRISSLICRLLHLLPRLLSRIPMTNICLSPGSATTLRRLRSNEQLHASPGARWDLPGDPVSKPLWLFNHRSGVLRAAVTASPGSDRSVVVLWKGQQVPLRPACGAAVHQLGSESACQSVPTSCTLCLRKACAAVFFTRHFSLRTSAVKTVRIMLALLLSIVLH